MLVEFLSLVVVFLIFRLILTLAGKFFSWLGRGRVLPQIMENGGEDEQHREQLRKFVQSCDEARAARRFGIKKKRPRLTREQKKELGKAAKRAREKYLDTMKLTWYQLVIIFLVGSVAGLFMEELWMYITAGLTQSRVGLVWGPFSPLYGFGACLLTVVCWNLRKHHANNLVIFLTAVVVGGALEQFTGWSMMHFFHMESWTYQYLPDHITRWVAWRFLFFWGVIGLVWARLIMPEVLFRIGSPTTVRQVVFVALLAIYLSADIFMTMACFIRMAQRNAGIPPQNGFEVWIDENYTNQFIAAHFQNLVVDKTYYRRVDG